MMLLLDTHVLVWLASDQAMLTETAKEAVRKHAGDLALSAISGLEIALAVKRGRLELPTDPEAFIAAACRQHGVEEIAVSCAIGCRAARLPDIHSDPFDRIIIATAQTHGALLLSKDSVIPRYPEANVIWD